MICVWDRLSWTVSPSSYQQRACVRCAGGDRDSRSPRSQVDRREAHPHLCAPAHASVTALSHPPSPTHQPLSITSASPSQRWGLPLLPSPRIDMSPYPSCPTQFRPQHLTLSSSCGQQQASASTRGTGPGACRVLISARFRPPDVSEAVLGLFLARAMASAHVSFAVPPRWPLHPQPTPNDSPTRLCP